MRLLHSSSSQCQITQTTDLGVAAYVMELKKINYPNFTTVPPPASPAPPALLKTHIPHLTVTWEKDGNKALTSYEHV